MQFKTRADPNNIGKAHVKDHAYLTRRAGGQCLFYLSFLWEFGRIRNWLNLKYELQAKRTKRLVQMLNIRSCEIVQQLTRGIHKHPDSPPPQLSLSFAFIDLDKSYFNDLLQGFSSIWLTNWFLNVIEYSIPRVTAFHKPKGAGSLRRNSGECKTLLTKFTYQFLLNFRR